MKELSIEEKAKAYDEALHKAKRIINVCVDDNTECRSMIACIQQIFPELKESEDERIRKEMIGFFKGFYDNKMIKAVDVEPWLAWLEKQGEHANFRNKIQIGDKVTRNEDGMLVNLSQLKRIAKPAENKGKHNMGISEATKKKLEDNLNKALEKETPESCNEFLDKQGEQKPYGQRKECKDCQMNYAGECKGSCQMKKDEQKPAWSEEDEDNFNSAIYYIRREPYMEKTIEPIVDWLESLKDKAQSQNTWKPSDAQIASITCAVRKMKESSCYDSELVSLLNDLKKLKG